MGIVGLTFGRPTVIKGLRIIIYFSFDVYEVFCLLQLFQLSSRYACVMTQWHG